jgi:hypothetical protein
MKLLALTILGGAVLGSAVFIAKDPPGGKLPASSAAEQGKLFMNTVAPNTRPVAVEAKPQIRKDAVRKKLMFGPHIIPAAKVFAFHELNPYSNSIYYLLGA